VALLVHVLHLLSLYWEIHVASVEGPVNL
jgi:hypothetical protein